MDETRTDDDLIALVLAGDREAFAPLVARHAGVVRAVVWRYLPRGDAGLDHEDACQEVFVRAYTRLASYRPTGRFGAWLSSVGRNYCIDVGRRRRGGGVLPDLLTARPDPAPGPEGLALGREAGDRLADAIAGLTARERGAVVACCCQGRAMADAAGVLGVPATTVRARLFNGRQKLRAALAGR
jgi:RNA polymerase sigma factor (sigma-70 family)